MKCGQSFVKVCSALLGENTVHERNRRKINKKTLWKVIQSRSWRRADRDKLEQVVLEMGKSQIFSRQEGPSNCWRYCVAAWKLVRVWNLKVVSGKPDLYLGKYGAMGMGEVLPALGTE